MAAIFCPRCGVQAGGGNRFWGWSKPFCTACGWNVALARDRSRSQLRQMGLGLIVVAIILGYDAYSARGKFDLFPFGFFLILIGLCAIVSWKRLKLLVNARLPPDPSSTSASQISATARAKQAREATYQHLQTLPRPRPVRFKSVPRVIFLAFPTSWILIAYFAFKVFPNGLASSSLLTDLAPLLIIVGVWSVISVVVARRAWRDRKLLQEGDFAMATVTRQTLTGGRHPRSKITYEFKDRAGVQFHCDTTDDSRTLYEEMETPIFYNPANPTENVPLISASCELKQL